MYVLSICIYLFMYACETTRKKFSPCIPTVILIENTNAIYEYKIMPTRVHNSKNKMLIQN